MYPAPHMAPAIVEPYNAILTTHTSLESTDVSFLVDNQVVLLLSRSHNRLQRTKQFFCLGLKMETDKLFGLYRFFLFHSFSLSSHINL